jgi:hypothetical protein
MSIQDGKWIQGEEGELSRVQEVPAQSASLFRNAGRAVFGISTEASLSGESSLVSATRPHRYEGLSPQVSIKVTQSDSS